jgi:hypothetical protein
MSVSGPVPQFEKAAGEGGFLAPREWNFNTRAKALTVAMEMN